MNEEVQKLQNSALNKLNDVKEREYLDIKPKIEDNLSKINASKEISPRLDSAQETSIKKEEKVLDKMGEINGNSQIESKNNNFSKIKQEEKDSEIKEDKTLQDYIAEQKNVKRTVKNINDNKSVNKKHIKTGIEGFDELLVEGIPKGSTILVAGGTGSGKTIFCLQTLINKAKEGKKCLYMSFEEKEDKIIQDMESLGWNPQEMIKKGLIQIQRINPFDIIRNVDALIAKQKGELLIEINPIIITEDFNPEFIFLDSLTAIASVFIKKEESYRIYVEQLFRFLENIGATSFLITETEQIPKIFSKTGVEEFLADGVIVMYNLRRKNIRENAVEILKLRGANHQKKIVAMQITPNGIIVHSKQELMNEIK